MKLAIASGKGGTGKTTLAVALAMVAESPVCLLDCDVEEPNAHLFLWPEDRRIEPVTIPVPVVDESRCTACGACARLCRFNAIVTVGAAPLVFAELCHSCGGCARVCPTRAIAERDQVIGCLEMGHRRDIEFIQGRLEIGRALSPPLIRAVKRRAPTEGLIIIDCPPGTACPLVTAARDCDFVLLVTEPTPFGHHDLRLAVETMRALGRDFGVVINRCDAGDDRVDDWCRREAIEVLARIPDDRRVAEAYSRGIPLVDARPEIRPLLAGVLDRIRRKERKVS